MKRNLIYMFVLLTALIACKQQPVVNKTETVNNTTTPAPATEVSTTTVIERAVNNSIEVTGTLEGQEEVTVSSEVEGTIAEINFDLGTYVKAGDLLVSLDKRELQWRVTQAEATMAAAEARLGRMGGKTLPVDEHPEVRQARAALEQAQADYQRVDKLLEKGDVSRQLYDQTKALYDQARARLDATLAQVEIYRANLEQSQAQLALARKQLGDAVVRAPVSGAIKERLVAKGEYLTKGRNVARIVQLDPLRLRVDVPEQHISKLRVGQTVIFHVDSLAGKEFQGSLTLLSPVVDKRSRALTIEARVNNADLQLKPGLFVRVSIGINDQAKALMVPQRAVTATAGLNKLYLVVDGQAQAREVKLGAQHGDMVEIIAGVKVGDQVVISNLDKLQDGSPLRQQ